MYNVVTATEFPGDVAIRAHCPTEDDAEEVAAALALAGFKANVYCGSKLFHEFFPSETV